MNEEIEEPVTEESTDTVLVVDDMTSETEQSDL